MPRPDLAENGPNQEPGCEAYEQHEDLPINWFRGDQAGCYIENRRQKWADVRKGGKKICRSEELCNPDEWPVIPIKSSLREQQTIGKDGRNEKKYRNAPLF